MLFRSVGSLTVTASAPPSCGQSGGLTVQLAPGRHALAGSNPRGSTWFGPIDIQAGGCLALELY